MRSDGSKAMSLATAAILLGALGGFSVGADNAGTGEPSDERPGVRMTPGMARALGGLFVRRSLVERYGMDESRSQEAAELVARRIMELAHGLDGRGQELIERFVEEQLSARARGRRGQFMPPSFGREFAGRILPMMPEIRQFVRNVVHDVRPMLPMKQQLRMAGELMVLNKAVDGFEETMRKWSEGDVPAEGNPFDRSAREEIRKDGHGASEPLARARSGAAEEDLEKARAGEWERYIEQARVFYGLDASQVATAESIRREMLEKLGGVLRDETWRQSLYHNRLWNNIYWQLRIGWAHPLRARLQDQENALLNRVTSLDDELKRRIDGIPTAAQRRAAEQRVRAMLAEKGVPDE